MNVSREVDQAQLVRREPAGEQAKSPETPVVVNTANLMQAALVAVLEGNHDAKGAIRQADSSLDGVGLELRTKVPCSDSATMLTHKLYLSSREGF